MVDERDHGLTDHDRLITILERTDNIKKTVDALERTLYEELKKYVLKVEYQLIKMFVIGMIGLILTAVGGAVVSLVVMGKHP